MPSTGRGSIASTASENSFASTPVVCTNSAITPAKGPRPTATTNSTAKTSSLIARKASISRRTGCTTQTGAMLLDDRMPNGTAAITDSTEPQTAICTVRTISSI